MVVNVGGMVAVTNWEEPRALRENILNFRTAHKGENFVTAAVITSF